MAKKQRKRERVYGRGGVNTEPNAPAKPPGGGSLWEGVKSLVLALVLFLVLRSFVIQNFVITSGSMEETLLVGDFLISRAFQMVVEVGDMRLMQILADGSNIISEGEVLQLINCRNPATSEADYLKVIAAIIPRDVKISVTDIMSEKELDARINLLTGRMGLKLVPADRVESQNP